MPDNLIELNTLLNQAEYYLNQTDFISAYNIYKKLILTYTNSPEIYNNLAIAAYQLNHHQEAVDYINLAIKLAPNNPLYIIQFAQFLFTTDFEIADQLFNQALELAHNYTNNVTADDLTQIKHSYATLLYNQGCVLAKDITVDTQLAAIDLFKKSLRYNSSYYKTLYNIACCYININDLTHGIEYLHKTLDLNPNHTDSHFALSQYYQQNNNNKLAETHLAQSLQSSKNNKNSNLAVAEYNYGVLEQQRKNYDQALAHYKTSLDLNPNSFATCYNIASVYQKIQNYPEAIKYYKQALALNPNDPSCTYILACLLSNQNMQKAPAEYIELLFDNYAADFEHELINNLDYKTPEILYKLFTKNLPELNNLNILDLGCGTGLISNYFKTISKNLIGVDLSQKMLAIANAKNNYTNLIKSDIDSYLEININNHYPKFNLIILADVLVYYGDLENLFVKIKENLEPQGHLLFSIELSEAADHLNDYNLSTTGRYTHSLEYIKQIIFNKFTLIDSKTTTLRTQNGHEVQGMVFLLDN